MKLSSNNMTYPTKPAHSNTQMRAMRHPKFVFAQKLATNFFNMRFLLAPARDQLNASHTES